MHRHSSIDPGSKTEGIMGSGSQLEFAPAGRTLVAGGQTALVSLCADRAPAIRDARVSPTTLALDNAMLRAALQQERDRRTQIEDALRCYAQREE
jgi:hypothetical protein